MTKTTVHLGFAVGTEAVLSFLRKHNGVARFKELIAVMPKEPGQSDAQRESGCRNAVQRLRVKGVIGRTGDTWSLAGAGSE